MGKPVPHMSPTARRHRRQITSANRHGSWAARRWWLRSGPVWRVRLTAPYIVPPRRFTSHRAVPRRTAPFSPPSPPPSPVPLLCSQIAQLGAATAVWPAGGDPMEPVEPAGWRLCPRCCAVHGGGGGGGGAGGGAESSTACSWPPDGLSVELQHRLLRRPVQRTKTAGEASAAGQSPYEGSGRG